MLAHRDYYAPLLEDEEEAARLAQDAEAQQEADKQQAAAAVGLVDAEAVAQPGSDTTL